MKGFNYLRNVATLRLAPEKCIGCGRCIEVCPHQVFSMNGRTAAITRFDSCMECGACSRNCSADAISVDAGVGCATGLINEWLRERNLSGMGGECCS